MEAVLAIRPKDHKPVDLHMVELMQMQHKTEGDTTLVKGPNLTTPFFSFSGYICSMFRLGSGPWFSAP